MIDTKQRLRSRECWWQEKHAVLDLPRLVSLHLILPHGQSREKWATSIQQKFYVLFFVTFLCRWGHTYWNFLEHSHTELFLKSSHIHTWTWSSNQWNFNLEWHKLGKKFPSFVYRIEHHTCARRSFPRGSNIGHLNCPIWYTSWIHGSPR